MFRQWWKGRGPWADLPLALVLLAGCGGAPQTPAYEDEQGFHMQPPPGWSERARPAAAPGGPAQGHRKGEAGPPPPPPRAGRHGAPEGEGRPCPCRRWGGLGGQPRRDSWSATIA